MTSGAFKGLGLLEELYVRRCILLLVRPAAPDFVSMCDQNHSMSFVWTYSTNTAARDQVACCFGCNNVQATHGQPNIHHRLWGVSWRVKASNLVSYLSMICTPLAEIWGETETWAAKVWLTSTALPWTGFGRCETCMCP